MIVIKKVGPSLKDTSQNLTKFQLELHSIQLHEDNYYDKIKIFQEP